jgi:hypothetical protein
MPDDFDPVVEPKDDEEPALDPDGILGTDDDEEEPALDVDPELLDLGLDEM